jgi:uncharacterized protein (TIRG00374 family)
MSSSTRKLLLIVLGILILGFIIRQFSDFSHLLGDFSGARLLEAVRGANAYLLVASLVAIYACYALRALRWQVFQRNLGRGDFWTIYKLTLAGFSAIFLLGRAGEPVRPMLLSRKEKLPMADMFGLYFLERLLDTASTAVIAGLGLVLFESHAQHAAAAASAETARTTGALTTAARTTGTLLFLGVTAAVVILVYLRLHGTAMLERRLAGWHHTKGWRSKLAGIILGFARGVQTIRTWGDFATTLVYSALHWVGVAFIYVWVSHALGGNLLTIGIGDALLILAFTMVGSAVQLPGVGGGSQIACFLAYTTIFGVEKEPAAAAAILVWLITFAGVSLAGVPLLIHEGMSLGELRRIAQHDEEVAVDAPDSAEGRAPAATGESAE